MTKQKTLSRVRLGPSVELNVNSMIFLFQGKSSSLSSETIDRARRSGTGLATKSSNQQANELTEIRKEIKKNLEKMRDENLRVCSSPLGSVSNLDAAFISVSFLISFFMD